jgi:opacity protein-like surface antigen
MRNAAFLPKARRQSRNRAVGPPVCAEVQSTGGVMKWKVVVSLLAFLSLFTVASQAQEASRLSVFGGYSYVRANPSDSSNLGGFSMNGGNFSAAYKLNGWLSGVADIGGYHATRPLDCTALGCSGTGDFKGNTWTYLFGPRVTFRHFGRVTPFAEVLFGVAHTTPNVFLTNKQTDFAMSVGGGVDYRLSHRLAIRPLQLEYLQTRFKEFDVIDRQTQNNLRLSTGIVFRF